MTNLSRNLNVVNATLAIGTHVFMTPAYRGALYAVVDELGSGGTANIEYTFDDREEADILSGTNPAGVFAADVASAEWNLQVVGRGAETLEGPITAVKVTVAVGTVRVIVAPQPV